MIYQHNKSLFGITVTFQSQLFKYFSIETEEHYKATLEKIPDYGIEDEDVKWFIIYITVNFIDNL